MHHPMPAALPNGLFRDISREVGSRVGVHVVPVEGVKQGVGGGEVVVWEVSPGIRLGQGRWVLRQVHVVGVGRSRRVLVIAVWWPGVALSAVHVGRPAGGCLGSFNRRRRWSRVHGRRGGWLGASVSSRGGSPLLIFHGENGGSGNSNGRHNLTGSSWWR